MQALLSIMDPLTSPLSLGFSYIYLLFLHHELFLSSFFVVLIISLLALIARKKLPHLPSLSSPSPRLVSLIPSSDTPILNPILRDIFSFISEVPHASLHILVADEKESYFYQPRVILIHLFCNFCFEIVSYMQSFSSFFLACEQSL